MNLRNINLTNTIAENQQYFEKQNNKYNNDFKDLRNRLMEIENTNTQQVLALEKSTLELHAKSLEFTQIEEKWESKIETLENELDNSKRNLVEK
jgi:hypothetical protein